MAEAVYVLCTLTSLACAVLLYKAHRIARTRLLFWSALCFAGLTANNLLLLVDMLLVPDVDLSLWRSTVALAALLGLIYALVYESS